MKKIWGAQILGKRVKIGPKAIFCHFLKFGSLIILSVAYDDSLEQCLTTSKGKINKKKLRSQTGQSRAQD